MTHRTDHNNNINTRIKDTITPLNVIYIVMVIEATLQLGAQSRKQGFVVTYFFNHSYFLLGRIKEEGEAPLLAHYKHYF